MFAWYYLGYGSPDDEVSTLGVFSKIPIIGSVLDAKNEDIALSILYSVYGIPDSGDWGDYPNKWNPNSANSYMTTGIMGYLNSLVVHTSNTVSWVKSVYDRLGYLLDVERSPFFGDERTGFKGVLRSLSDSHGFLVEIRDSLNGALYGTDDAGNRQSLWQLLYSSQHGIRAVLESVANTNVYLSELKNAVGSIIDNQSKSYELLSGFANRFDKYYDYMYNVFSNDKSQLHLRLKSIIDNQSKSYELLSGFANRFNKYYDYMNSVFSNTKSTLYLELAKIREAIRDHSVTVDGLEVTADLSPVTQRLDEIARLLSLSGQSSLLDSFVGDFTLPVSSALSARVQAALQNAFPFCIPAVMKQVLGLLDVEPVAAQVDYEIMGATVSMDFSAGGFAAQIALVTSWLCRILFVAMLLACSRNFIFAMPSKGG